VTVLSIFRLTIDPVIYTPVIVPFDTNNLWLLTEDASNAMYLYTKQGVDSSRVTIFPGIQFVLTAEKTRIGEAGVRYPKGTTVGTLLAAAGTGPAVIFCFY
jgi:hypothetical protein